MSNTTTSDPNPAAPSVPVTDSELISRAFFSDQNGWIMMVVRLIISILLCLGRDNDFEEAILLQVLRAVHDEDECKIKSHKK
jgi:hypothetical protein